MKRLLISAVIIGSAFVFTSCATNNGEVTSNAPQDSPFAPPNNAIFNDVGYNHWPLTFTYQANPGTETGESGN